MLDTRSLDWLGTPESLRKRQPKKWGARHLELSDFSTSVKLHNGRIRRKIAECGFKSISELCRKSGLLRPQISALLNLKLPPLTGTGRWRRSAAVLAEVLGCTCEELFSEAQRTLALRGNRAERFITETGFLKRSGRVERPLQENPGEQLLEAADDRAKINVIRRALDGLKLSPRDRQIIESHFGIGCEERTLADLALEQNVSPQCVQNRLNRALWRLRCQKLATRRLLLQAYKPGDAMGRAQEARARMAQEHAIALSAEKSVGQISQSRGMLKYPR